jgi:streptogrisin C
MQFFLDRKLCAAVLSGLALSLVSVQAQSKELPAIDPAVLSALSRDLKLAPQQVVTRVTAERNAMETHISVRRTLGEAYAGAWFDSTSNTLVVATNNPKLAKIVLANGARPVVVTRNFGELKRIQQELDEAGAQLTGRQRQLIWSWGVDVQTNALVITVPAGDPDAMSAARNFIASSKVDSKAVRIEESHEGPPLPAETIRGGDMYFDATWTCSVGFSVNGGFLTAGHCGNAGDATYGFNSVQQGTFAASQFPTFDRAWVQTNGSWTASPCVGTGANRDCLATNNRVVGGSNEAMTGTSVCRWGQTTGGPHCGVIEARNYTVTYPLGNVYGVVKTSACGEPGDSGGPFMANYQAQGMMSGISGGTNCSVGGHTFFWPVNDALTWYGKTLTLSAVPPDTPANFSVTYLYSAGKYRFTASWSSAPGATSYHLSGHVYTGPNTSISWTVPQNYEDLSTEYYVSACNAAGCSAQAGPVYAQ